MCVTVSTTPFYHLFCHLCETCSGILVNPSNIITLITAPATEEMWNWWNAEVCVLVKSVSAILNVIVYIERKVIITPSCFFVPVQIFATGHFPSRARSRDLHFSKNLCRFSGFQRRTVCKHCECGKAWIQFSELLNSWSNSKYYHHDHFHGNGLISFPPRHNMANRVQFVLRWWMCVTAAAAVVDGTRVEKHQQLKFDPVYLRTSVISTLHVLSLSSPSIGLSHNSHDDAWPS